MPGMNFRRPNRIEYAKQFPMQLITRDWGGADTSMVGVEVSVVAVGVAVKSSGVYFAFCLLRIT